MNSPWLHNYATYTQASQGNMKTLAVKFTYTPLLTLLLAWRLDRCLSIPEGAGKIVQSVQ